MAAVAVPPVAMPPELSVRVTIKIGAPYSSTRTGYGAPFSLVLVVAEGATIFRERVRRHISTLNEIVWAADGPILFRPTANAPQSRYELLAEQDNEMHDQVLRLWRSAARRKDGHAGFVVEAFVYVTKIGNQDAIRRATPGRVEASTSLIQTHLTLALLLVRRPAATGLSTMPGNLKGRQWPRPSPPPLLSCSQLTPSSGRSTIQPPRELLSQSSWLFGVASEPGRFRISIG